MLYFIFFEDSLPSNPPIDPHSPAALVLCVFLNPRVQRYPPVHQVPATCRNRANSPRQMRGSRRFDLVADNQPEQLPPFENVFLDIGEVAQSSSFNSGTDHAARVGPDLRNVLGVDAHKVRQAAPP